MDELRKRVRKLEDYRSTLKPLIEETLQRLNREKGCQEPFAFVAQVTQGKDD